MVRGPTSAQALGVVELVPGQAQGLREVCLLLDPLPADGGAWLGELVHAVAGTVIKEADLFAGAPGTWTLLVLRVDSAAWEEEPGRRARLVFWAARAGAAVTDLGAEGGRRDALLALVRSAAAHQRHLHAHDLAAVLGARVPSSRREARGLQLDVGLGGSSRGLAVSNVSAGGLFIPCAEVPPVGDVFHLALHVPAGPPHLAEVRVAHIRRPGDAVPGKPAGLGVVFTQTSPDLFQALACYGVTGGDGTPSSGRTQTRYQVSARLRSATRSGYSEDVLSNLSIGGAFVKSATPPPVGAWLDLHVELPSGLVLDTPAQVAFVSDQGMGVKFQLPPGPEQALALELVRISCRPKQALLAEADPHQRDATLRELRSHHVNVIPAATPLDALQVLEDDLLGVDVVILALTQPGDDVNLVAQLRWVAGPLMPLIALSRQPVLPALEQELRAAGLDGLVGPGTALELAVEEALWRAHRKRLKHALGPGAAP